MWFSLTLFAIITLSLLEGVLAKGGIEIYGCVYFPSTPRPSFRVSFTSGGPKDYCMLSHGKNATMKVNQAGLTCTSVGFVEGNHHSFGKDSCDVDDSLWSLEYSGGGYSGSTMTSWRAGRYHNTLQIFDSSVGTNVIERLELYLSFYQEWDAGTHKPLYIVFQPVVTGRTEIPEEDEL